MVYAFSLGFGFADVVQRRVNSRFAGLVGAVIIWKLILLFVLASGLIVLVTIWTALRPAPLTFSESLSR
jgi:uncharacterized membrane protein YdcZ (DUF606 family)